MRGVKGLKVFCAQFWFFALALAFFAIFSTPSSALAEDNGDPETLADLLNAEIQNDTPSAEPIDENVGEELDEGSDGTAEAGTPEENKIIEDGDENSSDLAFPSGEIDLTGQDISKLPCLSVGPSSHGGRLVNGVKLESMPGIRARGGETSYGTPETIAGIHYAVAVVNQKYPGAHDLVVGDLSKENGGRMGHHKSHQSGRDADLGYYYKGEGQPQFFLEANARNLDIKRTWALLEALMEDNKTEYIFIDNSLQRLLYSYVKYRLKAPDSFLEMVFGCTGNKYSMIKHARGHRNHLHVRFWSPIAVAAAQQYIFHDKKLVHAQRLIRDSHREKIYVALNKMDKVDHGEPPATQKVTEWKKVRVSYRVRSGDTLASIAGRNGVKASALAKWNGIGKKASLQPGRTLVIYKEKAVQVEVPVFLPEDDGEETARTPDSGTLKPPAITVADTQPQAVLAMVQDKVQIPEEKTVEHSKWATVKKGDTLATIAKSSGTTVDKICRLNGITKKTHLHLGQKLKVKSWSENITANSAATPVLDGKDPYVNLTSQGSLPSPRQDAEVSPHPEQARSFWYNVMEGDTLYTIAVRFGLKVSDLCQWNNLTPGGSVAKGQRLIIHLEPKSQKPADKVARGGAGTVSTMD